MVVFWLLKTLKRTEQIVAPRNDRGIIIHDGLLWEHSRLFCLPLALMCFASSWLLRAEYVTRTRSTILHRLHYLVPGTGTVHGLYDTYIYIVIYVWSYLLIDHVPGIIINFSHMCKLRSFCWNWWRDAEKKKNTLKTSSIQSLKSSVVWSPLRTSWRRFYANSILQNRETSKHNNDRGN